MSEVLDYELIDCRPHWFHQIVGEGPAVALIRMHQPETRVEAVRLQRYHGFSLEDRVPVVE